MKVDHKKGEGIYGSSLLINEAEKKSMDKKIKEMGKQASLCYKATRDGFSR